VRETILAGFFLGEVRATELAQDVAGSEEQLDGKRRHVYIQEMDADFVVTREMAIALCDAVLRQELKPEALHSIGFALITSERFQWNEDDLLANIFWDWSCPEVNFALSIENVEKFRSWLDGSSLYPERPSLSSIGVGEVISETVRQTGHRGKASTSCSTESPHSS
jgi:hypothetical protein